MNCLDVIEKHAELRPGHLALASDQLSVTYGDLARWAQDVADTLTAHKLLPSDGEHRRVGVLCPDGLDYVVLCLGILRAGGCVVPVAGELSGRERMQLIETTGIDLLVLGPGASWNDAPGEPEPFVLPSGKQAIAMRRPRGANVHELAFDVSKLAELNPAFIRFSSGTTGRSKGVVLSHERLHERITAANLALTIGPDDRVIWVLPMAHHFAVSMMLYLMSGATTVLVESHLAGDIINAGQRFDCTVLYASPFHHAMLASDTSETAWPSLRLAVSTAFALSSQVADQFAERFGQPLVQALGIIEAGLPLINVQFAGEKPESIGQPTPEFEIAIRDEHGQSVPEGEVGELFLRGPGMLDAYLVPWKQRDEILEHGWFHTGDLARRDADGCVFLVGRKTAVINVAGMKCFPEEIEAVLREHPDVREARVIGRPHPRMGLVPIAEVIANDPEHPPEAIELIRHCKPRLAAYKRPLSYRFVDTLPKTASGKIKR